MLDVGKDLSRLAPSHSSLAQGTYSLLKCSHFLLRKGISLRNDWDQVDLGMEAAHDLNVKRLQSMASGLNEVDTGMDSVINNVHAIDLVLGLEIGIKSLFDVLHNWSPGVVVVDEVS